MYERNAIVLDRYFSKKYGYQNTNNLKNNFYNYCDLIEKIENLNYKVADEAKSKELYNDSERNLKEVQQIHDKLYKKIAKLEYNRNILYENVFEDTSELNKCLEKIEIDVEKAQASMSDLRKKFIDAVSFFKNKKQEYEIAHKNRKVAEVEFKDSLDNCKTNFEGIDLAYVDYIKGITTDEIKRTKRELIEVTTKNGAKEKIPFDSDVISKAAEFATEIARKEADCYVFIYEKTAKLLEEISANSIKLERHKKWKRDNGANLNFYSAEREYLTQFLDNERLSVMHGPKVHRKLMIEACRNLILDVEQMNNLYELILREEAGRSTKKAYKELYNKDYLKNIEDKERVFEEETKKIKLKSATVINSNYWRVSGIREVYTVFYKIITEDFEKELEDFNFERIEDEDIDELPVESVDLELPKAITIEEINMEQGDSNVNYQEIDKLIEEFNLLEENSKIEVPKKTEPVPKKDEPIGLEYKNNKGLAKDKVEKSLRDSFENAKNTQKDLYAALESVRASSGAKKKKNGLFKKIININTKNKAVEE